MINSTIIENIEKARRLALRECLDWDSPVEFMDRNWKNRIRGNPESPEFVASVRGRVVLTIARSLSSYDPRQEPTAIVWVGSPIARHDGKLLPNTSFNVLHLLGAGVDESCDHPEVFYRSIAGLGTTGALDSECLGFIPNIYEQSAREMHTRGDFKRGHGHTFGIVPTGLGQPSIEVPASGNPFDAVMQDPVTVADHLISLALENANIARAELGLSAA